MMDAIAQHPAPTGRTRRRALAVFAVLIGLFLMHGMPAIANAACETPINAQVAMSTAGQSTAPVHAESSPSIQAADDCVCDDEMASCTPLAGRDSGELLGALLALATVLALHLGVPPLPAVRARRERRGGISAPILDLVCVSRT